MFEVFTNLSDKSPGTFNDKGILLAIEIQLDMKDLLKKMMQQASRVVSFVVETTLLSHDDGGGAAMLHRSESFLAMPPPSHMSIRKPVPDNAKLSSALICREDGLELLSRAAAELPIVSPHLSGAPLPAESCLIPELELENENDAVSLLSVDQCADIVDTCLFGGDFSLEPPCKRTKIEG